MPSIGDFLIAEPFMQDPNFQRSVVLLCQKQEDGYVGFTISRKIDFSVGDLVEELADCTMPLFDGGPVGIDNLAAAIGEERDTIEDVLEPYLIQQGYLQRTSRGRIATRLAYEHFGLTPPSNNLDLLT